MANTTQIHSDSWKAAIDRAIPAVVTIHSAFPYSFDTRSRLCGEATGIIVDLNLGIILTNRHVVGEAPMCGRAVFQMGACQCAITPYYIDPIHDFALCKFDVENLHGLPLRAIELRPDLVEVGLKICVLGNDAGQVMSILPGVISRVDCNPPYWDALTHYLQASADTSGGSSGSPVINKDGFAVALMSGGFFSASTDVYLPVDRPLRALRALQSGQIISRGTIQSHWELEKPADCRARGLSDQVIQKHSPGGSGLLIAKMVLPEGPSDAKDFMDNAIEAVIRVRVNRNHEDHELVLKVQDLFELTPYRILQFAGATFHDVRYYTAFRYNIPIKGVVLADAEGSFKLDDEEDQLLCSLNNQPTPDLDAFIKVAQGIPDQMKIAVNYRNLGNPSHSCYATIAVDRHWMRAKMLLRARNENVASWSIRDLGLAPPAVRLVNQVLPLTPATECRHAVRKNISNIVQVQTRIPYGTNGAPYEKRTFLGLVISATAGFVIIPRSFNPSDLCGLSVIFRDLIELPARMVYEHALGFAVIQYDASLVQGPIGSVTFSNRELKVGDKTTIYGLNKDSSDPCAINTTVRSIGPLTGEYEPGLFYQPINVDVLHLEKDYICDVGVLLDDNGNVEALWLPFLVPRETMLEVELARVPKRDAQIFGVSKETTESSPQREFVRVAKVSCNQEELTGLAAGDILLMLGDNQVTQMSDLRDMFTLENLDILVVRNQIEVRVNVPTVAMSSWQSDRVVWFSGAQLEPPYFPLPLCARKLYSQIFVTSRRSGSPAEMYDLSVHHFITGVNGVATEDFDSFTNEIKKLAENIYCQITLVSLQGITTIVPLMPNWQDFKTIDAQRKGKERNNWKFQEF